MRLTERRLNRATLARQLLLERQRIPVVDAVRRIVAIQAQEPPSPFIALWNRVDGFDPADLDRALAKQQIVKASLMRITLHAVAADDYPAIHEAMQRLAACGTAERPALPVRERLDRGGRGARAGSPRLRDVAAREQGHGGLDRGAGSAPRSRGSGGPCASTGRSCMRPPAGRGRSGRGPRTSARTTSNDPAILQRPSGTSSAGISRASVPRRCRTSPSSRRSSGRRSRRRSPQLGDELERHEGPTGAVLYDVPGCPLPDEDTPAPPRLMAMWDSTLLAYADRARMMPPAYRKLVIRTNGDVLPTILVDGLVAGVWRPLEDGIEVRAFHRLPADAWTGLEQEAQGAAGVPGRARADRVPPLRPLVGRPPEGDGSAPRLNRPTWSSSPAVGVRRSNDVDSVRS